MPQMKEKGLKDSRIQGVEDSSDRVRYQDEYF